MDACRRNIRTACLAVAARAWCDRQGCIVPLMRAPDTALSAIVPQPCPGIIGRLGRTRRAHVNSPLFR